MTTIAYEVVANCTDEAWALAQQALANEGLSAFDGGRSGTRGESYLVFRDGSCVYWPAGELPIEFVGNPDKAAE